MSDMGEMFAEWRKVKAAKRSANRETSAQALFTAGIEFATKNGGAHLIVAGRFDFWPGTGLWVERGTNRQCRGVRSLIAHINRDREAHDARPPAGASEA